MKFAFRCTTYPSEVLILVLATAWSSPVVSCAFYILNRGTVMVVTCIRRVLIQLGQPQPAEFSARIESLSLTLRRSSRVNDHRAVRFRSPAVGRTHSCSMSLSRWRPYAPDSLLVRRIPAPRHGDIATRDLRRLRPSVCVCVCVVKRSPTDHSPHARTHRLTSQPPVTD